ncbi:MAG: S8 family serine peptidase, partial [Gammaproteobacteria bacterium]|nr:S8 family serine peptidase [Gammaproteobacteria bacterium]
GQDGGTPGEDINVETVWSGNTGNGVRIAIVDDGLDIKHEDLACNVVEGASYDYLYGDTDPTDLPEDDSPYLNGHGTAVAGVAAAVGDNGIGVRGVAPSAELVGYSLLDNATYANISDAMTRGSNDIASNSWGPADNGRFHIAPTLWESAIESGLANGRGGKGTIYTWAAGNGDAPAGTGTADNSNYDAMANFYGTFAIGALNDKGQKASYSEEGANLLVVTPSGEFCDTNATTTTDRMHSEGYNAGSSYNSGAYDNANANYTDCFNGTSSATPVASGTIALMLAANPNLSWRDVRLILAKSARQNDVGDADWVTNGGGLKVNHKYGYGVIDAQTAVNMAKSWISVGGKASQLIREYTSSPSVPITDGFGTSTAPSYGTTVIDTISITSSDIANIEFVEITVDISHAAGTSDLDVQIESPSFIISRLANVHGCDDYALDKCKDSWNVPTNGYADGWRFGSERYIDEAADGTWTIRVKDGWSGDTGILNSWTLKIYGRLG